MCLREKIGPDPRNFNQRVSLGRNDLLIRTFLRLQVRHFWTQTEVELVLSSHFESSEFCWRNRRIFQKQHRC